MIFYQVYSRLYSHRDMCNSTELLATFSTKDMAKQMISDITPKIKNTEIDAITYYIKEINIEIDKYADRKYLWYVKNGWKPGNLDPLPCEDEMIDQLKNTSLPGKIINEVAYVLATSPEDAIEVANTLFKDISGINNV